MKKEDFFLIYKKKSYETGKGKGRVWGVNSLWTRDVGNRLSEVDVCTARRRSCPLKAASLSSTDSNFFPFSRKCLFWKYVQLTPSFIYVAYLYFDTCITLRVLVMSVQQCFWIRLNCHIKGAFFCVYFIRVWFNAVKDSENWNNTAICWEWNHMIGWYWQLKVIIT